MKVALLHYHLKTGGVTTVVGRQVRALQGRCETLVLAGDRAEIQLPCPVVEIPEIGYDRSDKPSPLPESVADRILKAISAVWPDGCDVLHIHNPTLAKNRRLIPSIHWLQSHGISLFLQVHDFAEDGRPQAYSREAYPRDCHYGVINARDARILVSAGLRSTGVHLIPNAVEPLPMGSRGSLESCVVYPVRAIRRKNIGEAVLLSLFLRPGKRLHVSQPPTSAGDLPAYAGWRSFAARHGLRVRFETGRRHGFPAVVAAADSMVTTSVTEGFGFSFLEPWTVGKRLWGRRLGDICADFEKQGLRLDRMYNRLPVPFAWFDHDDFMQVWRRAILLAGKTYGHGPAPDRVADCIDDMQRAGWVDFGMLRESHQKQVLQHLLSDSGARDRLAAQNPGIVEPDPARDDAATIANNRRVVRDNYDLSAYGDRLVAIYSQVRRRRIRHRIDKTALLDAFLDLNRFSLLKWGAYAD